MCLCAGRGQWRNFKNKSSNVPVGEKRVSYLLAHRSVSQRSPNKQRPFFETAQAGEEEVDEESGQEKPLKGKMLCCCVFHFDVLPDSTRSSSSCSYSSSSAE